MRRVKSAGCRFDPDETNRSETNRSLVACLPQVAHRPKRIIPSVVREQLEPSRLSSHTRFMWIQPRFSMHRDWWALDNVTVLADALPQGWQALPQWQLTVEAAQMEIKDAQCCFGTDLCEHRRGFVRYDQERCNMTYPEYELAVPTRFDDGAYAVFGCVLVWLCRIVWIVSQRQCRYCVACYRGCCGKPDDETLLPSGAEGVSKETELKTIEQTAKTKV